ncbi:MULTISPECIES: hypothetical protein [Pectobacterium]|uniref:Uncharacterized protein n=1 Tax=Pectobacterium carotovorum subsp. carotovorum TaxID=555 RepID=A0AAI9PER6_PECCC|nr:hypothetical protein [Pectobacterium carotovorum]MDK9422058.1 hypothetical protein [Pectobacterium carotovorum]QLL93772.1 hypothetical protein HER17_12790 [Pectobacterium carotovorum]GKX47732.1 hypothetical protein SOASR016_24840 [Pectobacterium carotovorum subsp. carotovorum]GLV70176.1 hypothetical protein Pcaca03_26200 [Pectobacterium carotovorum subsp. carotovorum]
MVIIETHHIYSNGFDKEEQDKEIFINGKLTYTNYHGSEIEYDNGKSEDSPFYGQTKLQTLYFTDKGTVQHNHEDDSFYFTNNEQRMVTYIDRELQDYVIQGEFDEFINFANDVMKYK